MKIVGGAAIDVTTATGSKLADKDVKPYVGQHETIVGQSIGIDKGNSFTYAERGRIGKQNKEREKQSLWKAVSRQSGCWGINGDNVG